MSRCEEWVNIYGLEGYYCVSNFGNIKSLDRLDSLGRKIKGRSITPLKQSSNSKKYLAFQSCVNGIVKNIRIHHVVAEAFIGPRPKGYVVDHIDNNTFNNNVENLQYITNRENCSKDKRGCSSNFTGVHWSNIASKWCSKIKINGRQKHLGYFESEIDASEAYRKELEKLT